MNLIKRIAAFMRPDPARASSRARRRPVPSCRVPRVSSRRRRGVAAMEFALTLPIWITMLLGAADGTYCLLVNEKSDRIAYSVTDIVTQYQTITIANLKDILQAASQLMQPFPFGNNGVVIVTSVYKPAGQTPVIEWQYAGGGTLTKVSAIGTTGGVPTLPNGLTLNDNDNVIISEVYYNFTPLFLNVGPLSANTVYRVAMYKPRLSQLIVPPT
jgi:hypothetical protein